MIARSTGRPWPTCPTCGAPLPRLWRNKSKGIRLQFCSQPCVPRQVRVAGGQKGRAQARINGRFAQFRAELKRLRSLEKITGDELVACFVAVADRNYDLGYSACESKWLRRKVA